MGHAYQKLQEYHRYYQKLQSNAKVRKKDRKENHFRQKVWSYLLLYKKKHMLWWLLSFNEALLMRAHNICFCGEMYYLDTHPFPQQ